MRFVVDRHVEDGTHTLVLRAHVAAPDGSGALVATHTVIYTSGRPPGTHAHTRGRQHRGADGPHLLQVRRASLDVPVDGRVLERVGALDRSIAALQQRQSEMRTRVEAISVALQQQTRWAPGGQGLVAARRSRRLKAGRGRASQWRAGLAVRGT